MRFHVQLLNPYPPGIIKTKHWRFNVQYLNPHPPHVMSCDQRPTPGGWHVAWCGKEIGPQHPNFEVEAAILASKRLRSRAHVRYNCTWHAHVRYNYTWHAAPGSKIEVEAATSTSKPLRSENGCFDFDPTTASPARVGPGPESRSRSSHSGFEVASKSVEFYTVRVGSGPESRSRSSHSDFEVASKPVEF